MEVALAALWIAKSTAGPCMSSLIRNGYHGRGWTALGSGGDGSSLLIPVQSTSLKGIGRAHIASVIERTFRATVCACNARCDVTPDMMDRINSDKMMKMKTQ